MEVRINKFLSEAGVCSRREADRQIEAGNVTIGGKTARMGDQVSDGQEVCFCGRPVQKEKEMILIALNKPAGIVCTAEKREKNNVIDFLHYPKRIYPVGRLDKESEGLLLLTNNGEIVNKIMRSGTRKCRVERTGKKQFRIILTQGLNRQIRRMCEYFGYRVQKLVRVRIMNIELGDLESGKYRDVTPEEFKKLKQLIAHSSNQPVRPMEKPQKSKRKPRNSAIHGTYTVVNHHIDRENKNGNRKATD